MGPCMGSEVLAASTFTAQGVSLLLTSCLCHPPLVDCSQLYVLPLHPQAKVTFSPSCSCLGPGSGVGAGAKAMTQTQTPSWDQVTTPCLHVAINKRRAT